MNKQERFEIAKEFSKKILEKYKNSIRSIIIFGSSVRGDFRQNSDIDIAIIYNNIPNVCEEYIKKDMMKVAFDINKKIDIFLWEYQRFTRLANVGFPLITHLVDDGITLFGEKIIENLKGKLKPTKKLELFLKSSSDEFEKEMNKCIISYIYSSIFNLLHLICIHKKIKTYQPKELINKLKLLGLNKYNETFIKKILKLKLNPNKEMTTYEIIEIIREYKKLKKILENKLII